MQLAPAGRLSHQAERSRERAVPGRGPRNEVREPQDGDIVTKSRREPSTPDFGGRGTAACGAKDGPSGAGTGPGRHGGIDCETSRCARASTKGWAQRLQSSRLPPSNAVKTILVTGAAGFIGFHLAQRLLQRGDRVIGLDNLNEYYDPTLKHARLAELEREPGFGFHRLDLADDDGIRQLFTSYRFDAVAHLAAQAGVRYSLENPHAYVKSNIHGFLNILEGCRHHTVPHLVYASTSSVYGANTGMPFSVHGGADHPLTIYAATKRADELMAHSYASLFGVPCTGLRFFTVYGPYGLSLIHI